MLTMSLLSTLGAALETLWDAWDPTQVNRDMQGYSLTYCIIPLVQKFQHF